MTIFEPANAIWWNKPLVKHNGVIVPAELAALQQVLQPGEVGVWMNSRGLKTGVVGFNNKVSQTIRIPIPEAVSNVVKKIYKMSELKKGCPDLVIWRENGSSVRFVEVKCPHWDTPSSEQISFLRTAERLGLEVSIFEWQFAVHVKQ